MRFALALEAEAECNAYGHPVPLVARERASLPLGLLNISFRRHRTVSSFKCALRTLEEIAQAREPAESPAMRT